MTDYDKLIEDVLQTADSRVAKTTIVRVVTDLIQEHDSHLVATPSYTDFVWYGAPVLRSVLERSGLYASSISPSNTNFFFGSCVVCGGVPIVREPAPPAPPVPPPIVIDVGDFLWFGSDTILGNQSLWYGLATQEGPDSAISTPVVIPTVFENQPRVFWYGKDNPQSIINPSVNLFYGLSIFPGGVQLSATPSQYPTIEKFIPAFDEIDTSLNPHDPISQALDINSSDAAILVGRANLPFDPLTYMYGNRNNYKTARVFIELTRDTIFDSIIAGKLTTKEPENVPFGSDVIWVALTEQTVDGGKNQVKTAAGIKNPFDETGIPQIYEDDFNRPENFDIGNETDTGSPAPHYSLPWWEVGDQLGYDSNYDVGITHDGALNEGTVYHPSSGTSPETKGYARWNAAIGDDDFRVFIQIKGPINTLTEYGLIVRYIDKNNYYRVYTSNEELILERMLSGVASILATSRPNIMSGLTNPVLGLQVLNVDSGGSPPTTNKLTVFLNDQKVPLMINITDDTLLTTNDRAGFSIDGILARADNWRIITVPDNPIAFPGFTHLLGEGDPTWDFSGVGPPDVGNEGLLNQVYSKTTDSVMLVREEFKIMDSVISTKSFICNDLKEIFTKEYLVGLTIFVDTGDNISEQRIISDFDSTTGEVTLSNFFQKDLVVGTSFHFYRPVEDVRIATHAEFKTTFLGDEVNADIREQAIVDPTGGCSGVTDQTLGKITHEILSKSNDAIELVSRIRIEIDHSL